MIDQSLIQGSEAWLALRKTKVTASDIPVIMGLSPYKTPKQLFVEKVGDIVSPPTVAMQYGTEMEPTAREFLTHHLRVDFYPCVKCHPKDTWLMASIDGYNEKEQKICEIKCPYSRKLPDTIPEHHYAQIQAQLYVTGLETCEYLVYLTNDNFMLETIRINFEYINNFLPKAKLFYECMKRKDFSKFEALEYDLMDGEWWETMADHYRCACRDYELALEKKERIRDTMVSECRDRPVKACGLKIEKKTRKGTINYKEIEALKNIDLEAYRNPVSVFWQISEDKS